MQTFVFLVSLTAALTAVLAIPLPTRLGINEGAVATQTIRAPRDVSFESEVLTKQRQQEAAAAVEDVLVQDSGVKSQQISRLSGLLDQISRIRQNEGFTTSERRMLLERLPNQPLSLRSILIILSLNEEQWSAVMQESQRILAATLDTTIAAADVPQVREALRGRISQTLSSDQVLVIEELVRPLIVANMRVDQQATERAREAARDAVTPVQVQLTRGQVIVSQGSIVTAANVEAIEAAGLLRQRLRVDELASVATISTITALLLALYIHIFQPRSVASERRLALLVVVMAVWVLAARLYIPQVLPDNDRHFLAFLLPVAAAPMLMASLLDVRISMLVAGFLSLLITYSAFYLASSHSLTTEGPMDSLRMVSVFIATGLIGAYGVHRADRMYRYLLSGVAVALMSLLVLIGFWFLDPGRELLDIAWMALSSSVGGLLAVLITLGSLIVLGLAFGITTRFQLMELAQLSHPLLRRLQEEAPGTFHHSVIVGNLAERAADLIGADALLVRVGCYYHDIGKVARPSYYIENQMGGVNPHDSMEPTVSARIIIDHIKNGLDLARRHRLPAQVQAFIPEHHGTRLATYFYRMASQQDINVDPRQFQYPGPIPQSRETAIVMLADSVEAMVRASQDRSPDTISRLVDEVIAERLAEGQLDECDLTVRDIRTIAASFKTTLRGVYHPRIEYPAPTPAEQQRSIVSLHAFRLPHRSASEPDRPARQR